MLDIGRWNWETHRYDPYRPDDSWHIVLYSQDMDLKINCADCGKEMTYGEGFTSRELHNQLGLGYPVCEESYSAEWKRYEDSKSKED